MTTKSPNPRSTLRPAPAGRPVVGVIGLGDMGAAIAAGSRPTQRHHHHPRRRRSAGHGRRRTDTQESGTGKISRHPAMYDIFSKDMKVAAKAAGQRGLVLPIVSAISAMIIEKAQARDEYLKAQGVIVPIPRCPICTLELAYPFREAGMHPECASESV